MINTGVSVTIPAGSIYALTWGISYANSLPQEIRVSTSSSSSYTYELLGQSTTAFQGLTTAGYTPEDLTLYLFGKWQSNAVNGANVKGYYEPAVL